MSSLSNWELIRNGDVNARNKVWQEHQDAVDYVARRLASTLPRHVPLDDLKSAGQLGLLDAINKFDPDKGFKFETYALTRIRGSILDDLRSQDWVPRSVRQRDRKIDTATQDLIHDLGREPTNEEIAAYLDKSVDEVVAAKAANYSNQITTIDQTTSEEGQLTVADTLASDDGDPLSLMSAINIDSVVEAIRRLPHREGLTLTMHYALGMTLADIGRNFGVTESRVCQIHTKALRSIREGMVV